MMITTISIGSEPIREVALEQRPGLPSYAVRFAEGIVERLRDILRDKRHNENEAEPLYAEMQRHKRLFSDREIGCEITEGAQRYSSTYRAFSTKIFQTGSASARLRIIMK